jgi:hypothetical protein
MEAGRCAAPIHGYGYTVMVCYVRVRGGGVWRDQARFGLAVQVGLVLVSSGAVRSGGAGRSR